MFKKLLFSILCALYTTTLLASTCIPNAVSFVHRGHTLNEIDQREAGAIKKYLKKLGLTKKVVEVRQLGRGYYSRGVYLLKYHDGEQEVLKHYLKKRKEQREKDIAGHRHLQQFNLGLGWYTIQVKRVTKKTALFLEYRSGRSVFSLLKDHTLPTEFREQLIVDFNRFTSKLKEVMEDGHLAEYRIYPYEQNPPLKEKLYAFRWYENSFSIYLHPDNVLLSPQGEFIIVDPY